MMGPGKAELLERIGRTGSIAAAGREMGMSYKRAWQLVEVMNAMFREPVVTSSRGGAKGGGAQVTEAGEALLEAYRGLEAATRRAGGGHLDRMEAMLAPPEEE
ncbi:LysR family transcriptional regulator [Pseudooceanicola sp. CBS1P-1]|nr:LysR family transcriptional regulator [Pseudooceanicola endophyticus]